MKICEIGNITYQTDIIRSTQTGIWMRYFVIYNAASSINTCLQAGRESKISDSIAGSLDSLSVRCAACDISSATKCRDSLYYTRQDLLQFRKSGVVYLFTDARA